MIEEAHTWYLDFVDMNYAPVPSDLICLFRIEPSEGISMEEAMGRVASESSNGTWTELTTMKPRIRKLSAKAFNVNGYFVKIAYPVDLFEPGNMPQIFSSIAGNIFGMKALKNLRLECIGWPKRIVDSFKGPQFGIDGIRRIFRERKRPLTATVPKPKVGMNPAEHSKVGYEAWLGGIDLLKDDENLTSQRFNKFSERAKLALKLRDKAERDTGEKKSYLINISSETKEMIKRARLASDLGCEYVMVDILTVGWAGLQTIRDEGQDLKLAIHAHRAFHSAFTRNPFHGVSMLVIAQVARLIGCDQMHIGTVVGKLVGTKSEVQDLKQMLQEKNIKPHDNVLEQSWYNKRSVFPVSSGGLHPGIVPDVMAILGNDIIIQAGGGVYGHPDGIRAGATALRQAIDATMQKVPLKDYAETHKELRRALEHWGYVKPV
ncbi:MAG: type III ribulose-bisphosphate carboxylase [Thermoproteota archaeon]